MSINSLLISLIRPADEVLRKRKLTVSQRFRLWLYRFMLKRNLRMYRRYAVSDKVAMDNGRVVVVHELRDLEFEKEIIKAGVANRIVLKVAAAPFDYKPGPVSLAWHRFHFTDTLKVIVDGREVLVEHGESFKVTTTKSKFSAKRASFEDYLVALELKETSASKKKATSLIDVMQRPVESPLPSPRPAKKAGLSGRGMFGKMPQEGMHLPKAGDEIRQGAQQPTGKKGDVTPPASPPPPPPPPLPPPPPIKKNGFDIDTSF